jgi:hypothetical protein
VRAHRVNARHELLKQVALLCQTGSLSFDHNPARSLPHTSVVCSSRRNTNARGTPGSRLALNHDLEILVESRQQRH